MDNIGAKGQPKKETPQNKRPIDEESENEDINGFLEQQELAMQKRRAKIKEALIVRVPLSNKKPPKIKENQAVSKKNWDKRDKPTKKDMKILLE